MARSPLPSMATEKRARASVWSKPSAATCSSGCGSTGGGGWSAATCAIRPGSSGRCWKPQSRATSSRIFRSATNRSTAPIPDTTFRAKPMRKTLIESLTHGPLTEPAPKPDEAAVAELAQSVNRAAHARLGRSLSIRHVDAGSCNGCELEIHALSNAFYDLERFGLRFVASPPEPKWVVAIGDCALNGGVFAESYSIVGGVSQVIRVDLHIPGCPPSPLDILKGLLALLQSVNMKSGVI